MSRFIRKTPTYKQCHVFSWTSCMSEGTILPNFTLLVQVHCYASEVCVAFCGGCLITGTYSLTTMDRHNFSVVFNNNFQLYLINNNKEIFCGMLSMMQCIALSPPCCWVKAGESRQPISCWWSMAGPVLVGGMVQGWLRGPLVLPSVTCRMRSGSGHRMGLGLQQMACL